MVEEKPILIVTAGDVKIDNAKFKAQFKTKAKMLAYEEVEACIGHAVGGVCPFAVKEGVAVYLDESLKRFQTVFPACGSSNSAIELTIDELVEEGLIDLDAPISEYMDASEWFIDEKDCDRITIRDLLNQTSGITTYQTFGNLSSTSSYGSHVYANANYGLLGLIIEEVCGLSYEEYVTQNIFEPLGMEHSAASLEKSKESIDSMFYDNVSVDHGSYYYGIGWMYSTKTYSQPMLWHAGLVENYTSNMFIIPKKVLQQLFLLI